MKNKWLLLFTITLCFSCTRKQQATPETDVQNAQASKAEMAATDTPQPEVKKDKTLIYCSEGSPTGFNPQLLEDGTSLTATDAIYTRLVTAKRGTTTIVPDLAESWTIAKDQKSYTFKLRKDVKFHTTSFFKPTRNFNADDVLFSFNRQRLKDHPYHNIGGGSYLNFEAMDMNIIQDIKRVDDSTVTFFLKKPDAVFIANLTMEFTSIMSAEYADQMMKEKTPELFDTRPIGTGPYIFKNYEKDSVIRYDANQEYYGDKKTAVDKLIFLITTDSNVRAQKIKAGECHILGEPSVADYKTFQADDSLKIQTITSLNMTFLAFNTKKKPFDNLLVRKAIYHALNRNAYIDAIYHGMGEISESAMPPTMWGFNNNLPTYDYSIEKSKALLTQAGYPKGFATEIWALPVTRPYNPDGKKMAEMMQSDLEKVGIKAKIVSYDWPTYLSKSKAGDHTMLMFGWTSDNGDPDNFLYTQLSCSAVAAGSNRAQWCYKPYDTLVESAKRTADVGKRTELYMDAQKVFKEQVPWVPIASGKVYRVMRKDVEGFVLDALGRDFFDGVTIQR